MTQAIPERTDDFRATMDAMDFCSALKAKTIWPPIGLIKPFPLAVVGSAVPELLAAVATLDRVRTQQASPTETRHSPDLVPYDRPAEIQKIARALLDRCQAEGRYR